MRHLKFLFISCCVLAYSVSMFAQKTGVIQGRVVDESGNSVADARVTWYDQGSEEGSVRDKESTEVQIGTQPSVQSDGNGHFLISHLILGHKYALVADKEEAGYPDMSVGLYNPTGKMQIATAQPKDQAADFAIRIGPKASRLAWDVKDAATGTPIKGIYYAIHRVDGGGESAGQAPIAGSAPGIYSWLVPSDVSVTIEFSAPGYKTWYYPGTAQKAASTFMATAPGQTTKLDVLLQPVTVKSQ